MPLDLHKITLSSESRKLINNKKLPDLSRALKQVAQDAIEAAGDYGLMTAKSLVPIDTLELRGKNLKDGMIRKSKVTSYTVRVFVTDDRHVGNGHPQSASNLAKILDSGINEQGREMHRSRNSAAIQDIISLARGAPTRGWIGLSDRFFTTGVSRYMSSATNRTYT